MNFVLHTMLDATGVVLRVHYKSVKCDVLFSQGSVRTLFSRVAYFSYMSKKSLPLYNSAELIKIDRHCPKLWSCTATFLWFTVYMAITFIYLYSILVAVNNNN